MIWIRRWWHRLFCSMRSGFGYDAIYKELYDVWVCAACGQYWGAEDTGEEF